MSLSHTAVKLRCHRQTGQRRQSFNQRLATRRFLKPDGKPSSGEDSQSSRSLSEQGWIGLLYETLDVIARDLIGFDKIAMLDTTPETDAMPWKHRSL